MAIVTSINVNNDVGLRWLQQYNLFLTNVGYVGRDDAQIYYADTASAFRLSRTDSTGRLDFSLIPHATYDGTLQLIQGSNTAPSLFFSGDTNTGFYSPGLDQVAIATNGVQALLIDGSQSIAISGTLAINGGSLNSSASTFSLLGQPTTINVGSSAGTVNFNAPTVGTNSATLTLFNTTATTINAFGAAGTLNIANLSSPQTINVAAGAPSTGAKQVNLATGGTGSSVTSVIIGGNTTNSSISLQSPDVRFNNVLDIQTYSGSLATTTPTTVHSFSSQTFKGAIYRLEIYNGQNFYSSNLHVVHNGISSTTLSSDVQLNEYSLISGGVNPITEVTVALSGVGGSVQLIVTPSTSTSMTIKVVAELILF